MLNFSIGSLFFAVLLFITPIILRIGKKYRTGLFLIINIAVFLLCLKSLPALFIGALWILVPYFMAPLLQRASEETAGVLPRILRNSFYLLMVAVFAYLMHYEWVPLFKILPYSNAVKLLGLSYFLFREIDFTMQYGYLKETNVRITLVDYLNYILNFYTVMAGPILRYEEFVTDFYDDTKPEMTGDMILHDFHRIMFGYIKVYVISAILSVWAGYWFQRLSTGAGFFSLLAEFILFAFFNSFYIYFNFSGYCDVVAGGAHLSGMTLRENFDQPYFAVSLVEFWNRHHITLSEWIRDYIYSPVIKVLISGAFRKKIFAGQCVALFITFLIAGIWHGTNFNYVVYGLLQGLGIVISTLRTSHMKKKLGKKGFKEFQAKKWVRIVENCATWAYISASFSFVGYDVCGLIAAHFGIIQ